MGCGVQDDFARLTFKGAQRMLDGHAQFITSAITPWAVTVLPNQITFHRPVETPHLGVQKWIRAEET